MAIGYGSGNIYISEKLADGNQFAEPYYVDTWGASDGYFAMDFAVADYNEDGNADFVLSLGYTASSGLYLGDGQFGFESKLLPNTAASSSAGADAADFNNDGHADFVIAPASDEPFFVSLGNGKGNIYRHLVSTAMTAVRYGALPQPISPVTAMPTLSQPLMIIYMSTKGPATGLPLHTWPAMNYRLILSGHRQH